MAKEKKTSPHPKKFSVTRKGRNLVLSWELGASGGYEKQELIEVVDGVEYPAGDNSGIIGGKKTSYTFSTKLGYWDSQYDRILGYDGYNKHTFKLRGLVKDTDKINYTWSKWQKVSFTVKAPIAPTGEIKLVSPQTTTFSYSAAMGDDTKEYYCLGTEWDTVLVPGYPSGNGNDIFARYYGSRSHYKGTKASDTIPRTETISETGYYSYTRWYRVRSFGQNGNDCSYSNWVYPAPHVYAKPYPAQNVTAWISQATANAATLNVTWSINNPASHPIDKVTVQWTVTEPVITVSSDTSTKIRTLSCPPNATWSSREVSVGQPSTQITLQNGIEADKCVFVRVITMHDYDENSSISNTVLAQNGYGIIKNSQLTQVTGYNPTTQKVSVTISRSTSLSNTATGVFLRTLKNPSVVQCVGIIESSDTTATIQLPTLTGSEQPSLGVREFTCSYTPKTISSDTLTYYTFLRSPNTTKCIDAINVNWTGGDVPMPPDNVKMSGLENNTGIEVTWDWSWPEATKAELSWADHEDAWNSTSEPQTYLVPNTNSGNWHISGLALGSWWVRIRFLKETASSTTYGAYYIGEKAIKLASVPDIPSLMVSPSVISQDGSVTFTWAYTCEDGSAQMAARIYEVIYQYVNITEPTGNPNTSQYYEQNENGGYYISSDTSVVPGKTYYKPNPNVPVTYGAVIAETTTPQHIVVYAKKQGWNPNETRHFAIKVMSAINEETRDYSEPVDVTIADKVAISITSTSLIRDTFIPDDGTLEDAIPFLKLSSLSPPLTINTTGTPISGSTTYIIERSRTLSFNKPDTEEFIGFEGELVCMKSTPGDLSASINQTDLSTSFDDNGWYRVKVIAKDAYGQTATTMKIPSGGYTEVADPNGSPVEQGYYEYDNEEYVLSSDTSVDSEKTYYLPEYFSEFKVEWAHQAVPPEAVIEKDETNIVSFITPIQPTSGYETGDTVDIYRLSSDKPALIIQNGSFGTKYVDPYPTLGDFGGYRIVYKTYNDDFIAADDSPAWTDYLAMEDDAYKHDRFGVIIDFDDNQVILPYNISVSSSWKKDFVETKYLGGAVQGDWNPAVSKTASIKTVIPVEVEPENVSLIRLLAEHAGICHVRTPDGSSFTANVEVKDDREEKWVTKKATINLDITRVDVERLDGVTYTQWINR